MDSKSLMIGDWVHNSYHKKNIKWNYGEMFTPNGFPVIGRDLEPIPLTAEILEKNGCNNYWGALYNLQDQTLALSKEMGYFIIGHDYGKDFEPFIIIRYVHELQHALRLCGLTDLADNFKID